MPDFVRIKKSFILHTQDLPSVKTTAVDPKICISYCINLYELDEITKLS